MPTRNVTVSLVPGQWKTWRVFSLNISKLGDEAIMQRVLTILEVILLSVKVVWCANLYAPLRPWLHKCCICSYAFSLVLGPWTPSFSTFHKKNGSGWASDLNKMLIAWGQGYSQHQWRLWLNYIISVHKSYIYHLLLPPCTYMCKCQKPLTLLLSSQFTRFKLCTLTGKLWCHQGSLLHV